MKEYNTELRCTAYSHKKTIDMRDFVKAMEYFNGCPNSTKVNLHVHFADESKLLAKEIKVDIHMDHVNDVEGLEIIFDWNAKMEQERICRVHYNTVVGMP